MNLKSPLGMLLGVSLVVCASARFVCAAEGADAPGSTDKAAKKVTGLGTIEPEALVDVGAQVPGTIVSFGVDAHAGGTPIDFGSRVERGAVLAKIDSRRYEAAVEQAQAALEAAKAGLDMAKANAVNASATLRRDAELRVAAPGAISDAQYDIDKAADGVSSAHVGVAAACVANAKAALHAAEIDLDYTTIRSPIKGVVIDRRCNQGESVTAVLNSPSLFLIADIEKLQIWTSVNEADIGKIRAGQSARFTVDTYPGEVFDGRVTKIRLNATMTKDVVTYTVVVAIPKTDGRLLPYMTAKVKFK